VNDRRPGKGKKRDNGCRKLWIRMV
jgi:hypothetical protein